MQGTLAVRLNNFKLPLAAVLAVGGLVASITAVVTVAEPQYLAICPSGRTDDSCARTAVTSESEDATLSTVDLGGADGRTISLYNSNAVGSIAVDIVGFISNHPESQVAAAFDAATPADDETTLRVPKGDVIEFEVVDAPSDAASVLLEIESGEADPADDGATIVTITRGTAEPRLLTAEQLATLDTPSSGRPLNDEVIRDIADDLDVPLVPGGSGDGARDGQRPSETPSASSPPLDTPPADTPPADGSPPVAPPTASPQPDESPSSAPAPSPAPEIEPAPSPAPAPSATPRPPKPRPTAEPEPEPSAEPTPTPSTKPTPRPTTRPTPTPTTRPTPSPTPTLRPTPTPTTRPTPTPTPSPSPSIRPTPTPSPRPTPTPTTKPTPTPTPTPTPRPTPPAPSPSQPSPPQPSPPQPSPPQPPPGPSQPPTPPSPPQPPTGVPGPDNTGVPASVDLEVVYGDIRITEPGAVIDGLDVRGRIFVDAPNVTIRNSIIRGGDASNWPRPGGLINNTGDQPNLVIEDSTLAPTLNTPNSNGIVGSNFTARRLEITGVIDMLHVLGDNVTLDRSWLHDNAHFANDPNQGGEPSHDDSIQIQAGRNIVMTDNNISGALNSGIQITQGQGRVSDVIFRGNHADGGGCTFNIAEAGGGPIRGIEVTDNVFGRNTRVRDCAVIAKPSSAPLLARNFYTDGEAVTLHRG